MLSMLSSPQGGCVPPRAAAIVAHGRVRNPNPLRWWHNWRADRWPPPARAHPQGPAGRPARTRGGARPDRLAPVAAGSADRAFAPGPGPLLPPVGGAFGRLGAGDEARTDRGLRGRDLLRPFRRREGGAGAAAR